CDDMFPDGQETLPKSSHFDTPYRITAKNFNINKYLKQNTSEFNQEYERCMKNSIKKSQIIENSTENKYKKVEVASRRVAESNLPKTICSENKLSTIEQTVSKITTNSFLLKTTIPDKLSRQISYVDHQLASSTNLTLSAVQNTQIFINPDTIHYYFRGYCFSTLRYSKCNRISNCRFKHNLQDFVSGFQSVNSDGIMYIIEYAASYQRFYFFCQEIYKISLVKLNINQILKVYKMFYEMFTLTKDITCNIIKELLNRKMPLKTVVERIIKSICSFTEPGVSLAKIGENYKIFQCIERFIKPGEYWYIAKSMLSIFIKPNKNIIENILRDCINNKKLSNVQDINTILLSKLQPDIVSQLDEHLIMSFKSLLTGKAAEDTSPVTLVEDFGQSCMQVNMIASPDSKQSSHQAESSTSCNIIVTNRNQANEIKCDRKVNTIDGRPYILQPIDDLPEPRSIYRNHKNLWKFYLDLKIVKRGLVHEDYDYIIQVLKRYTQKEDANYFIHSCCNMIRTEIKRSDHHLKNIIQRTVQTGTFAVLRKILFDIGVNILVALMDEEAWRPALHLVESLKICDLPSSAEFIMLSAEIYLTNKKTLKALDLFKNKNIICTSRAKWRVASTVHDEYVRNKLIYILLDSLCNGLIDHAFYLFTFLLKDQSSQFYPIDLSRYVDKLIVLLLSKNEIALITEMANLILKYNFPLIMKTCRALITTLIHVDEKLAMQLFYYAESIGFYSTLKLWPVPHIIINNNLTEEEIYFVILQMLQKLKINFGHTIEHIKSPRIVVYLIFEVNLTKQFYSATQQNFNSKAIQNIKTLVRSVLKKRFDPPMVLISHAKEKICRLQIKSLINYLKSEHCN
ncbi:PREDICTED: uncharacterized protein LOC106747425, partial [Dinoponera quadriceps]|uniref:Uncharacterized protein LOC106747425 n=1 Tax=Dinoponera quadriceps TaxID=609295 RepID=A0A6P3XR59_DINQU